MQVSQDRNFSSLLSLHRELDEIFALHQELLVVGELPLAVRVFDEYVSLLELHMSHEEQWLLPLYVAEGPMPRFPAVLYTGQHRKMRSQLGSLGGRLARAQYTAPRDLVGIIRILDLEASYKHLAEHHDGAEAQGLFKALDAAMGDAEHELARRCMDQFRTTLDARRAVLLEGRTCVADRMAARRSSTPASTRRDV